MRLLPISTARIWRQATTLPISWVFVVIAIFVLWMVPSTYSSYHREDDALVAHYHRVSFGLLFYADVTIARPEGTEGSSWHADVDPTALLLTVMMTVPVLLLGRSSWRTWERRFAAVG